MMHEGEGLYKEGSEMLYSGALSVAPHNCVDADATAVAPQEGHQNRGRFFGPSLKNQRMISLSVGHDGERRVGADTAHCVRGCAPLVRAHADSTTLIVTASAGLYSLSSKLRSACGGAAQLEPR